MKTIVKSVFQTTSVTLIACAFLFVGTSRAQETSAATTQGAGQSADTTATQTAAQSTPQTATPSTSQITTQSPTPSNESQEKLEAAGAKALEDADTPHVSQVRIVRLSQVKGIVQLDRRTSHGFEAAFANLPIARGERLQTGEGVAEVEFEDNSSLRLGTDTLIEFPVLGRTATGATTTTVKLVKGTMYVSLSKTRGNDFRVVLGNGVASNNTLANGGLGNGMSTSGTVVLMPASHIRLDVDQATAKVDVFDGSVDVTDASGTTTVGKKRDLTIDTAGLAPPVLTSKIEEAVFDQWDKSAADYHKQAALVSAYGGSSGYQYGINDMSYYGSFANIAGCGSMWRPYFTSAAWDPFANGIWAWYPGAGYSWVSPYPWGWTPYHSGSWAFCGGGWGWYPGGAWIGLRNHPSNFYPPHGPNNPNCPRPPHAPVAGGTTLVAVNRTPLVFSKVTAPGTFVFKKDSAGLGVPRASLGNLHKVSAGVEQHGSVSKPVYEIPPPNAGGVHGSGVAGNRTGNSAPGTHDVHSSGYVAGSRSSGGMSPSGGSHGSSVSSAGASSSGGGSHGGGGSVSSGGSASGGGWSGSGGSAGAMAGSMAPSGGGSSGGGGGHH